MSQLDEHYPLRIRRAVDDTFLAAARALADANTDSFKANNREGARRKYWRLGPSAPAFLQAKKQDLIASLGITQWVPDPFFDDMISWISRGGAVHLHTDPNVDGRVHTRINVLIDKPEAGCVPVLDGIPVAMEVGDAWACFAGLCGHATTPVMGPTPRRIVSYGLQCERKAVFPLLAKHLAWVMAHKPAA